MCFFTFLSHYCENIKSNNYFIFVESLCVVCQGGWPSAFSDCRHALTIFGGKNTKQKSGGNKIKKLTKINI
jgi:hypothetical protein